MATSKFFFDNCAIGPGAIKTIRQITDAHPASIEVAHLMSHFEACTPDEKWIPEIADESWVVITSDRGKRCGGAKLPALCLEYHVTHVLLSRAVHRFSSFQRITAFTSNLNDLLACCDAPKGSRFHLRRTNSKALANLVQVDVDIPPIKKQQKTIEDLDNDGQLF